MINNKIKDFIQYIYQCYYYRHMYNCEIKNIKLKKQLWNNIILSEEQEKAIQSVYGKRISNKWHRLYQSFTGTFNKNYFPEILFSTKLEPILCPKKICDVLEDKSLVEILYGSVPELRVPKTIIVNCSGIFYDGNRNIISRDMAAFIVELWHHKNNFVIKPTLDSLAGKNVNICRLEADYDKEKIMKLFEYYKKNFIIQEYIINSDELRALNPKSLNTIRIMTYILDEKLYHPSLIIRIGKGSNEVDNVGAGGLFIGVSDDGYLKKEAFSKLGERYTNHPDSKIKFEKYYIPNIEKIINCAYACHRKTPHVKFISWDFSLDNNRTPVLIEANMLGHAAWVSQSASGESLFGTNTERMLELIGIKG